MVVKNRYRDLDAARGVSQTRIHPIEPLVVAVDGDYVAANRQLLVCTPAQPRHFCCNADQNNSALDRTTYCLSYTPTVLIA